MGTACQAVVGTHHPVLVYWLIFLASSAFSASGHLGKQDMIRLINELNLMIHLLDRGKFGGYTSDKVCDLVHPSLMMIIPSNQRVLGVVDHSPTMWLMLRCLRASQGLCGPLHALAPNPGASGAHLACPPGIIPVASTAAWTRQGIVAPSHHANLMAGSWGLLRPPLVSSLGQRSPR